MTLDELDKPAALARRYLDIGDLSEPLEEGAKLILSDIARQSSHEDCSVVGVGELVHWLDGLLATIVWHRRASHGRITHWASSWHTHSTRAASPAAHWSSFVLWRSGRNSHRTVAAIDTLHFGQGALLVALIGKSNEAVAARHARKRVGHDLGRLARRETALEERHKDVFVDLGAKIADKDGVLRSTVISAIGKAATRCPVEFERTAGVGHRLSAQLKSLGRSLGRGEIDKAIASVTATMSSET